MQNDTETKIKQDLFAEIQNLEQNYIVMESFIAGKDFDVAVIGSSIQSFKDSLSRASAFVLEDKNGKDFGTLGLMEGIPCLLLADEKGEARVLLSVVKNGEPSLVFFGNNGRPRAALGVAQNEDPALSLFDRNGTQRATLAMMDNEEPGLSLFDDGGSKCAVIKQAKGQGPGVVLWDENQKGIAMLTVKDGGRLSLRDENGKERVSLHIDGKEMAGLWVRDGDEKTLATMAATNIGPVLLLNDRNGKPVQGVATKEYLRRDSEYDASLESSSEKIKERLEYLENRVNLLWADMSTLQPILDKLQ